VKLTHELIKAQVTPIWPKHKVVTGVDTANIRFKIMRTHLSFKASNEEYESFKDTVNDSALLFGIDDEVMFGDDEAMELARTIAKLK